jgi:threonine efflux protein
MDLFSELFAVWLLQISALLIPGTNVLLVAQLAASGDRRGALFAAVGITIGSAIWACAAVSSLGAILTALPPLRKFMQVSGAACLLYFAVCLWRSDTYAINTVCSLTVKKAVRTGMFTSLSNPKAALFYIGVFSVTMSSAASPTLIAAALAVVIGNALIWHLVLASMFSLKRVQEAYAAKSRALLRLSAVIVGAMGLSLLASAL